MDSDRHTGRIKVLGILCYFSLLLWAPMLFASLMLFDAPGSGESARAWVFFTAIWVLPVALVVAPTASRKALGKGAVGTAYCLVGIPLVLAVAPTVMSILQVFYMLLRS